MSPHDALALGEPSVHYGWKMTRHLPEGARRDQILTAARKCFVERGYHPTRMEEIALAAGLSKGGVYFHFESKQEVFEALVQQEFEHSMNFIERVTQGTAPITEKIQVLATHFLEDFNSAPDAPRFFIVMGEMGLRDETLRNRLLEMQNAFIQQIANLIDQGAKEGVIRPIDASVVATLLKALLDGLEGMHALGYPVELSKLLSTGMEFVLGGLATRT